MTMRNLHGNAARCWAHLGERRCEEEPGHMGPHAVTAQDHRIVWHDYAASAIDVDGLDSWGDGAA